MARRQVCVGRQWSRISDDKKPSVIVLFLGARGEQGRVPGSLSSATEERANQGWVEDGRAAEGCGAERLKCASIRADNTQNRAVHCHCTTR